MYKEHYSFGDLTDIMEKLRAPGGCPWDREQDHESLKKYLIEETYEVLEAIDKKSDADLCEELGDVLLQVVFHANIAKAFGIGDVIDGICKKMISRHPHVFGEAVADTSEEVLIRWEQIKRGEKGITRMAAPLRNVPANLPALMRAYKVQQKAADAGFDWDGVWPVLDKVREELDELRDALKAEELAAGQSGAAARGGARHGAGEAHGVGESGSSRRAGDEPNGAPEEAADGGAAPDATETRADASGEPEMSSAARDEAAQGGAALCEAENRAAVLEEAGDLFFAAVNLSRFARVHPELALTAATEKFISRFEAMEAIAGGDGKSLEGMAPGEMDGYWERAKASLRGRAAEAR
jgi:tetrapyrrole methylase family protein/MazG family protein